MAWTKGEIVDQAFDELALAGYVFDLTPDERISALRRLDTMMATWMNNGFALPYAFTVVQADAALADDSGLPLIAIEATYLNLAVRIAASKGKALAASTRSNAKDAYDALASRMVRDSTQEQQMPVGMPSGAGQKARHLHNGPFLPFPEQSSLQADLDAGLTFT